MIHHHQEPDTILFSQMHPIVTKVHVKFCSKVGSTFLEKIEKAFVTNEQKNERIALLWYTLIPPTQQLPNLPTTWLNIHST